MRSRYSAYVLGQDDYLLATWHPATRPASAAYGPDGLRWLGLEVRRHVQVDENHAIVEFVARSKAGGKASRHHEVSRFERLQGHWFYLDAEG
jgi:SEC-C motif domain protein